MLATASFVLNAGAVVWGAAKLSSAVDNLKEIVDELKRLHENVANTVHGLLARVRVIEHELKIRSLEQE